MSYRIRRVDYYYASVADRPGEAYEILSELARQGVNLLAFTAVPVGPARTQMTLFPDDGAALKRVADAAGMVLDGPHRALLIQGGDEMGALAAIHEKLVRAHVDVYAGTAVTDGAGNFGYLVYVRSEDCDRAARALEI
ncbi:MAG: hypothetical protein RRA92_02320 [Gemmatimonadota bacterium]|nr:hypothetical protein [Gemmatimonadota bacterium]